MQRREFIRLTTTGSAALLVPNLLTGCGTGASGAYDGWEGHPTNETDTRLAALAYAVLAPNPHNKQPWMVELDAGSALLLYVDPNRLLPETDPPYRRIHIGQGTFIENLDLAARRMGYRTVIDWFPQGTYANTVLERKPVARIELLADTTVEDDPLFDAILERRSNKRAYDGTPLALEAIDALEATCKGNLSCSLTVTDEPNILETLRDIMREAMQIEVGDPARDAETLAMFRFGEDEVEHHRDGFGVANAGVTGLKRWVAETFFLSREAAERDPTAFGAQAVDLTTEQSASASAFGWLVTASNTRLDQVLAGRAYERLNLAATTMGVAMHPLSQVLQEYPDMAALQQHFKAVIGVPEAHTVQMLFRLGHARPTPHTARRALSDFVVYAAFAVSDPQESRG